MFETISVDPHPYSYSRSVSMKSISRTMNVHHRRRVISKCPTADGSTIQRVTSSGRELRKRRFQLVLVQRQVWLALLRINERNARCFCFYIDHTTGTDRGYYLYIETSLPQTTGQKARIVSPMYSSSSSVCVKFYYHMYGASIGTLNVLMASSKQVIWSKR